MRYIHEIVFFVK